MYKEMRRELPNGLPNWFRNEPTLGDGVYFTFPSEFLIKFKQQQAKWFSDLELARELELANTLTTDTVGFNRGKLISSAHLRKPVDFDDDLFGQLASAFGDKIQSSPPEAAAHVRKSLGYLNHLNKVSKAYLGWLIKQPAYWDDISFLKEGFKTELLEGPVPQSPLSAGGNQATEESNGAVTLMAKEATGREKKFFETVHEICRHWRISRFEAIECPILKTPKTSGLFDNPTRDGVHFPQLPDIYPVEGSGEHVDQMNQRRNATLKGHLQGWADISSKDSKNTQPYDSLSRQYQIQHIWRLLESRYPNCLARKIRSLKPILAEYLRKSLATIDRDLTELRNLDAGILDLPLETRF